MPKKVHFVAGLLATLTIATFLLSTVLAGLFGTHEAVAAVKALIGMPGLLVLIPCAIFLNRWAAAGAFDSTFYVVQAFEFLAGVVNLTLMGLNIRDGLRMSGRFGKRIANNG